MKEYVKLSSYFPVNYIPVSSNAYQNTSSLYMVKLTYESTLLLLAENYQLQEHLQSYPSIILASAQLLLHTQFL